MTSNPRRSTEERDAAVRRADRLSRLLDSNWSIAGIRFGLDSIVGLVPVVGDWATAIVGLAILRDAQRVGAPRRVLAQMAGNLAIDALVGGVPVLGDAFDVAFKANRRNSELLRDWVEQQR